MRIERIELKNYRGIESASVDFDEIGVTILQGPNEVGKSSVIEAFNLLLDQMDNTSKQAVKATQSIGVDAGPEVTAVFRTGDYRLRYHKRWFKDKETTLEIFEPKIENLTGREAHERVREILGETLDEVLWHALQFQQGKPHGEQIGNSVSLTNALDEAAGGAGSDRSDESESLWERVTAEYAKYFYKNGKPNADLSAIEKSIEDAETSKAKALGALSAVNDDVVVHDRLVNEIQTLEASQITATERKAKLEQEWESLKGTVAKSAALEHQLTSEQAVADQNKLKLEQREGLIEKVEAASAEQVSLQGKHSEQAEGRIELEQQRKVSVEAVTSTTETRKSAEQHASLAASDETHLRRLHEVAMMAERSARATATAAKIDELESELVGLLVDDPALEEISEANKRKIEMEARALSVSYRVQIKAHKDASIVANKESIDIEAGKTAEVTGANGLTIAIEDLVELRIDGTDEQRDLSSDAETAANDFALMLKRFGIDPEGDIAAASKINRRRQAIQTELTGARATQKNDLRDLTLDELDAKVERGNADVSAYEAQREQFFPLPPEIDAAVSVNAASQLALAEARAAEAEKIQARDLVTERLAKIGQVEAADLALIESAAARLIGEQEALDEARKSISDSDLSEVKLEAEQKVKATRAEIEAVKKELKTRDADSVEQSLPVAVKSLERIAGELATAKINLEGYKGKLDNAGQQGLQDALDSAESELEHAQAAKRRFTRRAAAAELLHNIMAKNRDGANQNYVAPFKKKVDSLGRLVFGQTASFEIDPGTLAISALTRDDKRIPFESLSAGAKEQTEMIGTLATAQLVSPSGNEVAAGVPVVFDDALGSSDPERLVAMGSAIALASEGCQVIVLTCDSSRYQHVGTAKVISVGIDT